MVARGVAHEGAAAELVDVFVLSIALRTSFAQSPSLYAEETGATRARLPEPYPCPAVLDFARRHDPRDGLRAERLEAAVGLM